MPTLGDIANQISSRADQIQANTLSLANTELQIKNDTADISSELTALDTTMLTGFAELGGGLFAILELARAGAILLGDGVEQRKVMLCWLSKHADLLCGILRRLDEEIEIRRATQKGAVEIARVLGRVHAREKLEVDAAAALAERISACCPPPVKAPEHCYDPCPAPRVDEYAPKGQDWKPPAPPKQVPVAVPR